MTYFDCLYQYNSVQGEAGHGGGGGAAEQAPTWGGP